MGQEYSTKQVDDWFIDGYNKALADYKEKMANHLANAENPKPSEVTYKSKAVRAKVMEQFSKHNCCFKLPQDNDLALDDIAASLHRLHSLSPQDYEKYSSGRLNFNFEGHEMEIYYEPSGLVADLKRLQAADYSKTVTAAWNRVKKKSDYNMDQRFAKVATANVATLAVATKVDGSYAPYAPVRIQQQHTAFALLPTEAELEEAMMLNSGRDRSASDTLQ